MDQASVIQSKIARLQAQLSELEAEAEDVVPAPEVAQPSLRDALPESMPEETWLDVFDIVPALDDTGKPKILDADTPGDGILL